MTDKWWAHIGKGLRWHIFLNPSGRRAACGRGPGRMDAAVRTKPVVHECIDCMYRLWRADR